MKTIIIGNIPDVMFDHIVNGMAGNGNASQTLSQEQQQKLVGDKIFEFCGHIAKSHAVNMAQLQAARQTAFAADGMISQTRQIVQISVGESEIPQNEASP